MSNAMRQASRKDDVDTLVDTLLAEPDRADDIKSMLRHKLDMAGIVHLKPVPASTDDLDDMWDNVPV